MRNLLNRAPDSYVAQPRAGQRWRLVRRGRRDGRARIRVVSPAGVTSPALVELASEAANGLRRLGVVRSRELGVLDQRLATQGARVRAAEAAVERAEAEIAGLDKVIETAMPTVAAGSGGAGRAGGGGLGLPGSSVVLRAKARRSRLRDGLDRLRASTAAAAAARLELVEERAALVSSFTERAQAYTAYVYALQEVYLSGYHRGARRRRTRGEPVDISPAVISQPTWANPTPTGPPPAAGSVSKEMF